MRNFTDLSVLPGHTITIDGESYSCPDLKVEDMQGSVRKVPADRILAVHWYGAHKHGSIEGFGAMEGFADRSQLAPFISAWLRGRAKAKAEAVEAIRRKKQQTEELFLVMKNGADGLEDDIKANPSMADVFQKQLDAILAEAEAQRARIPTDAQVASAVAESDAAQAEVDADA